VSFTADASERENDKVVEFVTLDFCFPLDQLREMHLRRYNLRGTALEFFLVNNTNYFVNFESGVRDQVPVNQVLSFFTIDLLKKFVLGLHADCIVAATKVGTLRASFAQSIACAQRSY
jgi:hypothetical protein